jgi:hypothetical protein
MASSDFWRDLAADFRALPLFHHLVASYYIYGGGQGHWEFGEETDFQALAMRAGSAVADPGAPDPLIAWLECLKQEGYFQGDAINCRDLDR